MIENWEKIVSKVDNFKIRKGATSFINPYSLLILKDQNEVASEIKYWCVDGISLVNKINSYFGKNIKRFSFDDTSVAPIVFQFAKESKLKIAIIGTTEEYLHKSVACLKRKYGIEVAYSRNGYFLSDAEKKKCFAEIIAKNIEMVVCGMGTPYQELFLIELQEKGWDGFGFTCGGYLHQIAKKENYYPRLFDKLNIRWIYRIIDEPRLFKRYGFDYPRFFVKFREFYKQIKAKENL